MIPRRNIQKISLTVSPIQEKTVEQDYVISWILTGLTYTKINEWLSFKGGTALKKIYIPNYRFSEDLDFTLLDKEIKGNDIESEFNKSFEVIRDAANIPLRLIKDKQEYKNTLNYHVNYSGPLMAAIDRGVIKLDITLDEKLIYPSKRMPLLKEYAEYDDLPGDRKLNVYDINEIFLEKLCCILDPKRKQPRDVYDLWYLLDSKLVDGRMLIEDYKSKATYKKLNWKDLKKSARQKESAYKSLWGMTLSNQMKGVPEFNETYRKLKQHLRESKYL